MTPKHLHAGMFPFWRVNVMMRVGVGRHTDFYRVLFVAAVLGLHPRTQHEPHGAGTQ